MRLALAILALLVSSGDVIGQEADLVGGDQISALDFEFFPLGFGIVGPTITLDGAVSIGGSLEVQSSIGVLGNVDTGGEYRVNGQHAFGLGVDGSNVLLGSSSGTGGFGSIYIGYMAGQASTTVSSDRNVYIGSEAGAEATFGRKNVYIGEEAGKFNSVGSKNVMIGENAGLNSMGDLNVFLGNEAGEDETGSNKLYIANSDTPTPLIYGEFDNQIVEINDVLRLAPRASPPSNPAQGTIYYDTDGALCIFNGASWDRIGSGACQ